MTLGFRHRCPKCGEADTLRISLADTSQIDCAECGEETTAREIADTIAAWSALLIWIGSAPVVPAED